MSVSITVRDAPNDVRDELAARSGRSLQEFLRTLLIERASRPSAEDLVARARARVEATGTTVEAATILEARDADRR